MSSLVNSKKTERSSSDDLLELNKKTKRVKLTLIGLTLSLKEFEVNPLFKTEKLARTCFSCFFDRFTRYINFRSNKGTEKGNKESYFIRMLEFEETVGIEACLLLFHLCGTSFLYLYNIYNITQTDKYNIDTWKLVKFYLINQFHTLDAGSKNLLENIAKHSSEQLSVLEKLQTDNKQLYKQISKTTNEALKPMSVKKQILNIHTLFSFHSHRVLCNFDTLPIGTRPTNQHLSLPLNQIPFNFGTIGARNVIYNGHCFKPIQDLLDFFLEKDDSVEALIQRQACFFIDKLTAKEVEQIQNQRAKIYFVQRQKFLFERDFTVEIDRTFFAENMLTELALTPSVCIQMFTVLDKDIDMYVKIIDYLKKHLNKLVIKPSAAIYKIITVINYPFITITKNEFVSWLILFVKIYHNQKEIANDSWAEACAAIDDNFKSIGLTDEEILANCFSSENFIEGF